MGRAVLGRNISRGRYVVVLSTTLAGAAGLCSCGNAAGPPRSTTARRTVTVRVADAVHAQTRRHAKARPRAKTRSTLPLTGRVVGVDPGHNGRNYTDPG